MKNWRLFLVSTLVTLTIGGIYLFVVFNHRRHDAVAGNAAPQISADDAAVVRMEFPQHFDDLKDMEGKSVWMKNGYTIPYFPYVAGKVDFAHSAGLIPPLRRLDLKKAIKAAVPASVDDSISHGSHQAMYVFTLPGDADHSFATPVGAIDGDQEQYFSDLLYFYDDPHTIYANWPKDVWATVDAHQAKPGMNELQTRLALGQKMHPDSQSEGDRTVTYDSNGKKWTVTFVHDHATDVKPG